MIDVRVLMYGSEHAAPATRVCDWAVKAGHEVLWAGYLGEISGSSPAQHVQIQSLDSAVAELAAIAADFRPHVSHSHNFSLLADNALLNPELHSWRLPDRPSR